MTFRPLQTLRQLGCLNAGLYALDRLCGAVSGGRWALYRYRLVAQAVRPVPLAAGRGKNIAVRLLPGAQAIPPHYPRATHVLERRFAQGAQCLGAFRADRLIGALWMQFDSYLEDEVRVRFDLVSPHSSWDFDVSIAPADRLGPAFARLWDTANQLLHAKNVRWSCSRISAFNQASLSSHARLGTVSLGSVIFLRCGRWQWMCASVAPYFHLSTGPASQARLRLDTSPLPPLTEPLCNTWKM